MRALSLTLIAIALLGVAALRDAFDLWIDATALPPLVLETSVEVAARDGTLLRAFTVADGRWRLDPGPVDPLFIDMLIAYEDRRFLSHDGVDPVALGRAALQAAWNGRVVSGGSTITMQVARLLEDSGTGGLGGQAASDTSGTCPGTAPWQGPDPRPLPAHRALWRQSGRRACCHTRLVRKGAPPPDPG